MNSETYESNTPRTAELYELVGNRLSLIIEARGLSNRKLQYLTGVDCADISRIRNGKIQATLLTLFKLSEGLNVPLAELLQDV